jgi:sterol desaturase/sphingolipid hydroxylase (fatty acid hydroxylase superfamily)
MQPALLFFAIPGFVILLLLELWYSLKEHRERYATKDTLASLSMGIGNVITGFASKALMGGAFWFIYDHWRITTLGWHWWVWVLAFFADDFNYYWFHRTSHSVRFFWASHVVHHSSQHYNLSTALRQTWTGNFTGTFIFWLWMPLAGFHPVMIMLFQQISLIYQFWIHTEAINKLPRPVEFIMNTPSHHRVHHGSDLQYLDKNHAGVLIIWDRLFGTFQPEGQRPTYGLTKNISTFNPFKIAFSEWAAMFRKAFTCGSFSNAIRYLVNPPGWSHDGSSKTAKQLREELRMKNEK